ncbi:Transcription elongation factor Spt4 [uncultured archaeon]|nr:Transcription elongation factor Spt4 [uncultured archaeon]
MASKTKACKVCNTIYDGDKCPECDSREGTESFKGKIVVLNAEKSEIAQKLKLNKAGTYAIKTR